MTPHRKRLALIIMLPALVLGLIAGTFLATNSEGVSAGPEIVGDPSNSDTRAIYVDNERVVRIEYFPAGVKTMANTTPVASEPFCGLSGGLHKAEVQLVGTMSGTNPTLAVKWQNSIDGGANWTDVGTWTTINATTTPATQSQVVADIQNATTAVAYGDCWRATYVFGGTGTVTANISVKGIEK